MPSPLPLGYNNEISILCICLLLCNYDVLIRVLLAVYHQPCCCRFRYKLRLQRALKRWHKSQYEKQCVANNETPAELCDLVYRMLHLIVEVFIFCLFVTLYAPDVVLT